MTVFVPGITETDLKKIVLAVQQLAAGRSNANGVVTLATGAATTVVAPTQKGSIAPASAITLTPMTAAAATEAVSGNLFISAVGIDTFTITHTNSATTGRTFRYAVQG